MRIFAIGDLHLSLGRPKPMEIFDEKWQGHAKKIQQNWLATISDEDIVLLPGDLSWATYLEDALVDLQFIHQLPGQKVCVRGNHDYWWQKINKLNGLFPNLYFVQNNCYLSGSVAICGTRGWICPNEVAFSQEDQKIFDREVIRLRLSLEVARQKGARTIIVMLHYPPTNENQESNAMLELLKEYRVSWVVYGHLHDEESFKQCLIGLYEGMTFQLVSADYLEFKPTELIGVHI